MFSISACAFPPVPLLVSYHDSVSSCFPPTNLKLGLTPWMNGVSAGTIRQTFATVPGQAYQLSFCYANNPDGPAQSATATVSVTGASPRLNWNISHAGSTPSQMNYTRFLGTFIAGSTMTTLQFASTTTGAYGIVLSAVSVTAVDTTPSA